VAAAERALKGIPQPGGMALQTAEQDAQAWPAAKLSLKSTGLVE
jgi:hypothetical protein